MQDFYRFHKTVEAIKSKKMAAYFVPKGGPASLKEAKTFFAIVPRTMEFLALSNTQWNRLLQEEIIKIRVAPGWGEEPEEGPSKTYTARMRAYPAGIKDLEGHLKGPMDLVLMVRCEYDDALKVFGERGAAESLRTEVSSTPWQPAICQPTPSQTDTRHRRMRRSRIASSSNSMMGCGTPRERWRARSLSPPTPTLNRPS